MGMGNVGKVRGRLGGDDGIQKREVGGTGREIRRGGTRK